MPRQVERTVTNASQTVIGTITYEGFGQTVATSGWRAEGDAGLLHVGARYYDPQVGRFLTRDTYLDEHPYLYCGHDPVNKVDPSGHGVLSPLAGIVVGTVGFLVGGPVGGAIGAGVGTALGDLAEGSSVGEAVLDGTVAGVGGLISAGLIAKIRPWLLGGATIGTLPTVPPIGALRPPVTSLPPIRTFPEEAFTGIPTRPFVP